VVGDAERGAGAFQLDDPVTPELVGLGGLQPRQLLTSVTRAPSAT
jgi:hypothetical protein